MQTFGVNEEELVWTLVLQPFPTAVEVWKKCGYTSKPGISLSLILSILASEETACRIRSTIAPIVPAGEETPLPFRFAADSPFNSSAARPAILKKLNTPWT